MNRNRAARLALGVAFVLGAALLVTCLNIETPIIAVDGVSPTEGQSGTEVTILGRHFVDDFSETEVGFNGIGVSFSDFLYASDTELRVRVPASATTGDVVVRVGDEFGRWGPFTVIGPYALVLNELSDNATVIDTHTQNVEFTVPAGQGPFLSRFSPDGKLAYIVDRGSSPGSVTVLRTPDLPVVATIPVGDDPQALHFSIDSSKAYVADRGGDAVAVIDTGASAVFKKIPVGQGPRALALAPDGLLLYVANETAGSVSVIDEPTDAVAATVVLDPASKPFEMAIRDDGSYLYVLSPTLNSLFVLPTDTPDQFTQVPLDPTGTVPIGMVKAAGNIYVAHANGIVSVVDTTGNTLSQSVAAGGQLQSIMELVTLEGQFVYVLDVASGEVVEISTLDGSIANRFPAGANPYLLRGVITAVGSFVYILNQTDPGTVTVYLARDYSAPAAVVDVNRGPVDVAFE